MKRDWKLLVGAALLSATVGAAAGDAAYGQRGPRGPGRSYGPPGGEYRRPEPPSGNSRGPGPPGGDTRGPGGPPGGGFHGRGGDDDESRQRRLEGFLRYLDSNGDGQIDSKEAEGRRRYFVERLAERAGVKAEFPVSVEKLRVGLTQQSQSGGDSSSSSKPSETAKPSDNSKPLVPGFGVESQLAPPLGFGTADEGQSGNRSRGSPRSSRGGSSSDSSSSSGSSIEHRLREHAKSLLKQYDKNENGVLEEDEWRRMHRSHWSADSNGDKRITVEELTGWLEKYSRTDSRWGSRSRGSSDSGKRTSYRPLTPHERLPKHLPEWFVEKDIDCDGQVAMAEYATDWTDAKAAEFIFCDLNNDGIITPDECLEVEKEE